MRRFGIKPYRRRGRKWRRKKALPIAYPNRFRAMVYQVSKNNTRTCWVLKCDIRKFFASIDHKILLSIVREYILDQDIVKLLENIISSFHTKDKPGVGLPLGNLTSQLFANVYMNKFDQWIKHRLGLHYYIRYADDFVFLSRDKFRLEVAAIKIQAFLQTNLHLSLHPNKVCISTIISGVDFLGWVHFPNHRVLRTKTKQRMLKKIKIFPV